MWRVMRCIRVSNSRSAISADSIVAQAARGGVAVGQRGIDRRHPHQAVEDQAEHPPVARRVELQPVADLALRHHGRQPCRHLVAPVPDHPEQAGGDQRRVEDDGRPGDLAAGARRLERARDMAADQRQDDHPVQRHQEAARRGIVDRRDATLRRAGPEPGAEQQVEGAPVEQRLERLPGRACRRRSADRRSGRGRGGRRPRAPAARSGRAARQARRRAAASGRPGGRSRCSRARLSRRRTAYSATRPATTMPSSSSAVRPSTMSGRLARWRPRAGICFSVNSSRSDRSVRNEPVAPSELKAVPATAEPAHAAAKPPSAAALANLDRVIVFPRRTAGKA